MAPCDDDIFNNNNHLFIKTCNNCSICLSIVDVIMDL